jgi:DNA repair photolyase
MLSGVTDCYQPAERHFRLTRSCLEVALAARQPVCIVTKNALVTRDLDLLSEMARLNVVHVNLSVTSLDTQLARVMEPRTSSPTARLRAIRELSAAGVPTGVLVAPVIPGLNDVEIPAILGEVSAAGARWAGYVLLRLPLAVRPVFQDWLARAVPSKQQRIESMIRATRGGKLNSAKFGDRMKGTGFTADQIRATFQLFAHRHHLDAKHPPLETSLFRPPVASPQLRLF